MAETRNPLPASPSGKPQRVSITDSFGASPVSSALDHSARRDPGGENTTLTPDRKSTRLNSSHLGISYAVFCLKKKNRLDKRRTHAQCPTCVARFAASARRGGGDGGACPATVVSRIPVSPVLSLFFFFFK